jgi:hypothetical protein
MPYVYAAIAVLCGACLIYVVTDWWLGAKAQMDRAARTENEVDAFVQDWLSGSIPNNTEHFQRTKELLMLDWLDAHPDNSRMDFCRFFDRMVDGHCQNFALSSQGKSRPAAQPMPAPDAIWHKEFRAA